MTLKQPSSLDTSAKKAPTGKPSPAPRPDVRSKVSSFGYGFQWGTSKDKNPHPRVCHFGAKELVQSISPELPSNQALLQQLRRRLLEFPEPYRGVSCVFEARPPFGTERIRLKCGTRSFLLLPSFFLLCKWKPNGDRTTSLDVDGLKLPGDGQVLFPLEHLMSG